MMEQVGTIWGRLPGFQKTATIVFSVVILGGILGIALWSGQPDFTQLRGGMSPDEASKVMTRLDSEGISYQVLANGRSILVEANDIERARESLVKGGLSGGDSEEGDSSSFLRPSLNRNEMQFAHARRLERSIGARLKKFDFIDYASVTITPAVNRYFKKGQQQAKATVQVKPIGILSREQVKSIAHSVAGGVQKLSADAVAIIDATTGIVLKAPSEDGGIASSRTPDLAYQLELERQKEMKIQNRLDLVYGPRRVVVSVSAEIDWERAEMETINYDPENSVVVSRDQEDSSEKGGGRKTGGATGTAAATRAESGSSGKDIKTKSIHETRVIASTKQATVKLGGTVKRLSVGVCVDSSLGNEIASIEKTIRAAIGFNQERGDVVQIHTTDFSEMPEPLEVVEAEEAVPPQVFAWVEYGLYGVLGVVFLFFSLRTIKRARASLTEVLEASLTEQTGNAPKESEEEQIIAAVNDDMELAGRSLKKWLYENTPA